MSSRMKYAGLTFSADLYRLSILPVPSERQAVIFPSLTFYFQDLPSRFAHSRRWRVGWVRLGIVAWGYRGE